MNVTCRRSPWTAWVNLTRDAAFSRLRPGNAYDDLEFMRAYKDYWDSNGAKGEQPPAEIQEIYDDCLKFGTMSNTDPEYAALGESILKRIMTSAGSLAWLISMRLVIISNRLGNTPNGRNLCQRL